MKTTPCFFAALFALLFLAIFNYTLPIIASLYIASDLGGSSAIAIYSVSYYALGNALGVPLGTKLSMRLGSRRLLTGALLLFALFTLLCALAPTFPFFVVMRFFLGLVAGPFYSLVFRLMALLAPENRKESFSKITMMIFAVVPVVGASWGGWIAYDYNWRWSSYFNLPIILFLALYFYLRLRGLKEDLEPHPIDVVGYFLLAIALTSLSSFAILGQQLDWFRSDRIIALLVVGVISSLFFIVWSVNRPNPIIELRLLKRPILLFALFNLAILFSVYFGMVILISLWLKLYVNYTPNWIALLLGTMAVAGLSPLFLVGRKHSIRDSRLPLSAAVILFAISCYHTMFFNVEINFGRIAFSRALAGFGLAFFLPPLFRLAFNSFPEKERLHVLSLFQIVRALSSGLGAAIFTTLWQRREVFFHLRLASKLTHFSEQTQIYFAKAARLHLTGEEALAQLDLYTERQAIALALDDCFYLFFWIMIGLLAIVAATFFFKKEHFIPEKD